MNKIILNKKQIEELIWNNRYRVNPKTKFLSRCIDGRYENQIKSNLPALAFPGGDVGELALIYATANNFGLGVDREKVVKTIIEVVGGIKNFGLHSDHHGDSKITASGCGHWKQINLDPLAYNLKKTQIDFVQKKLKELKKNGANEIILEGEHLEGAVVFIKGNFGIYPRYILELSRGKIETEIFVYHQTLVDERHRALAAALLANRAVKLYPGCDEDYLYQALSEMVENHLMETAKRLAKGLPIYSVKFDNEGSFEMEEMGKV